MKSSIDTIKKDLSEYPNAEYLIKYYFRFIKDQMLDPKKPEITIGYVGRFKLKVPIGERALNKTTKRIERIDTQEYDGKGDKFKRRGRLVKLQETLTNLLKLSKQVRSVKTQKTKKMTNKEILEGFNLIKRLDIDTYKDKGTCYNCGSNDLKKYESVSWTSLFFCKNCRSFNEIFYADRMGTSASNPDIVEIYQKKRKNESKNNSK